ncbi:MAG: LysE family transporter [Chloroflexi bacterium]|nr:LysE family transporter [Chloroflexota bacterium]
MSPFIEGVIAGYGIAIPVGAIAILIIDAGMRRGFWSGFAAGAGAASADFVFASLAAIAGHALADALTPFASALRLVSALVLIAMGAFGLWCARGAPARNGRGQAPPLQVRRTIIQTYAQFLALTLLNPMTIAYFAALILGNGTGTLVTPADRAAFVAGAVLASLSWQSLLAAIGAQAYKRFSPRAQQATSVIGNLVILVLGVRFLV